VNDVFERASRGRTCRAVDQQANLPPLKLTNDVVFDRQSANSNSADANYVSLSSFESILSSGGLSTGPAPSINHGRRDQKLEATSDAVAGIRGVDDASSDEW
jgi:hypothetical protein